MPSRSKSQQRLFGMVHAYQKGKLKNAPESIKEIAESISKEDAEHFAKTKHKGLPEKRAYEQGFMDKCAEFGIDPNALMKEASNLPQWLVDGLITARKTGQKAREIFTPEQMQIAGRMSRRAVRGFSKSRSMAARDASSLIMDNFPILGKGVQLTPEGAIRQYGAIVKAQTLPSVVKFKTKRHLRDMLEDISKGDYIRFYGDNKALSAIGSPGFSSSGSRRVKGLVRSFRKQMFSLKPTQRRKMLANYNKWLGVPQPNSAKDVANMADMTANEIRNMK